MNIQTNYSLKRLNQYGINAKTKYFVEIRDTTELDSLIKLTEFKENKRLFLGEGNNILFTKDFDGIIIKPIFLGKKILKEDEKNVWIEVHSGENWEDFVEWTVKNNYEGIENLTMIPSSVGGAVSQNIAAYGQNIMDVVEEVFIYDTEKDEYKTFSNKECEYTYRSSIFKDKYPNRHLIIKTIIKFNKIVDKLETSYHERASRYGSLADELATFAKKPYTINNVMIAVQNIRTRKLPSIDEYGTCGSVFANPVVPVEKYKELSEQIPELQSYPVNKLSYDRTNWDEVDEENVKIPAGRILDYLGWKGKWNGNVGMFENHALCLVTNRKASGEEVYAFLEKIRDDVKKHYDIDLSYEINIIK